MIETQYTEKIKLPQSDHGTKCVNGQFDTSGFKRRLAILNNSESKEVTEWKNRILEEMVRYLLIQSGLPPSFLGINNVYCQLYEESVLYCVIEWETHLQDVKGIETGQV